MKDSQTQPNSKLLGLAVILLLVNMLFHFTLWYIHLWHPMALLSILVFALLFLPFHNKEYSTILAEADKHIKESIFLNFPLAKYQHHAFISEYDFIKSHLYNNVSYSYSGDHLIQFKEKKRELSNIIATHHSVHHNHEAPIFDGVLAKLPHSINLNAYILIRPSYQIKNGHLSEVFKKLFQRYIPTDAIRIYTENSEFNKQFEIYSNDAKVLEKSLHPLLFQRILILKNKLMQLMNEDRESGKFALFTEHSLLKNSPLEIAITGDHIFVGIRNMKLFRFTSEENRAYSIDKSVEVISLISKMNLE